MKKKNALILGIVLVVLFGSAMAIRIINTKNAWICEDDQWIKSGEPTNEMPDWFCFDQNITNFERCLEAGYSVMESYPRQCRGPEDKLFVENIGNELEKSDLIVVNNPRPNQEITSPLLIEGEARGVWFFEGDFPVRLYKNDGTLIAEHYVSAQGEWMAESFVGFTGELEFGFPNTKEGVLILEKDNSSGIVDYNNELRIPVKFLDKN